VRAADTSIVSAALRQIIRSEAASEVLATCTTLVHDIELLSRDHRAARTYRALNARFQLLV
jgi:hypothetical protein